MLHKKKKMSAFHLKKAWPLWISVSSFALVTNRT